MKHKPQHLLSVFATTTCLSMPVTAAYAQTAETQTTNLASLEAVASCPTLLAELKEAAIKKMAEQVDASFRNAIRWGFCQRYSYGPIYTEVADTVSAGPVPPASPLPAKDGATEYSETNVQVTGVDEADFVKNDGSYIYMLANGKFRVVDAWPAEEASEIAAFDIEGTPKKLFVHNQQAFIYSSLDPIVQNDYGYYGRDTECTYGYDCDFTGDGRELKITVLDISDVTAPKLVRELRFSGAYLNSRRIENAIHSVVVFPEPQIAGVTYWPEKGWDDSFCSENDNVPTLESLAAAFETLKAENSERLQATTIADWLPSVQDINYSGGTPQENHALLESCDNFYQTGQQDGKNLLSIVSMDTNGEAPLHATTIMGKPGAVYASNSALYVAARHSRYGMLPWFFDDEQQIEEASTIHKFSLSNEPPASQYVGSGVVKGSVLNQFSMDEFEGFFRIATTTSRAPSSNAHSTISILAEKANELVVVGQIDNIAPTEDIRSARFMGDKGYVVTFKKTDPLFVFDLSDPHKPTIAGELKIPGFSTYMHRLDDDHLLTIGYDADDQGRFAWFQGVMLQIFDVSDMANPQLTHKEVIGTRGSTSEAATNHLAFNYFGSKGLLAIPMTICESDDNQDEKGGRYGDMMTFSGLLVYKINAETGFQLVGGVPHIAPESQNNYRGFCGNWWTRSNTIVKRSIFMDDYVFSITEDTIKANRLSSIGKDIAVVYFEAEEQAKCDAFHVDLCPTEPDCLSTNGQWEADNCRLPLYSPLRSSKPAVDACMANYDPSQGHLEIPCVNVAGTQHSATLSLTVSSPMQLALTASKPADKKIASPDCEVIYDSNKGLVQMPCITQSGDNTLYSADFKVLTEVPLTLELSAIEYIGLTD
ncbi:MAG: hypothetical protein DRR19_11680 [Candidatus Parabeggiatoa sp. nov. 1]|nr:MAG: hypothetical protein DRR19_11680 [Gammaproteobacteria bacterium]